MDFPKKQAQRLMPLYLLEYSEKLFTNHPNPEDPWGGGSDYTAGQGITITNNEISVDTNVIATKSDLPTKTSELTNDSNFISSSLSNTKPYSKYESSPHSGSWKRVTYDTSGILIETNDTTHLLGFPINKEGEIVVSSDIPDFTKCYYVNNEIQDGGYKTTIRNSGLEYSKEWEQNKITIDVNKADLENKASIVIENNGGKKVEISNRIDVYNDPNTGVSVEGDKVAIHSQNQHTTSLQDGKLTYEDGLVREFNLPSTKEQGIYTLATTDDYPIDDPQDQLFVSLTGQESTFYKKVNLSDAPGRMFYVNLSALNPVFKDGLTSTYNEQTNQLEVSLNASILHNFVTTDTNQKITGTKRFDPGTILIQRHSPFPISLAFMPEKFRFSVDDSVKEFYLPGNKPSGTSVTPAEYTLATTDDIPSTATSTSTSTVTPTTGTFVTGTSTNTTNVVNSVTYTPSSETLTFTYADNTTASFTFLTSSTTVTSGTTSVVSSVTDSTSSAMTGATVSTSTTTTLS